MGSGCCDIANVTAIVPALTKKYIFDEASNRLVSGEVVGSFTGLDVHTDHLDVRI
jgi:hypothetical protein